jgi:hypothetical protein
MNKYRVRFFTTTCYEMIIEAENEEEASNTADEINAKGLFIIEANIIYSALDFDEIELIKKEDN